MIFILTANSTYINKITIGIKYLLTGFILIFYIAPPSYIFKVEGGRKMSEIKEIKEQIEKLRINLHKLIDEKNDLLDPDVVAASQMLDAVLNKYNEIINKSLDK